VQSTAAAERSRLSRCRRDITADRETMLSTVRYRTQQHGILLTTLHYTPPTTFQFVVITIHRPPCRVLYEPHRKAAEVSGNPTCLSEHWSGLPKLSRVCRISSTYMASVWPFAPEYEKKNCMVDSRVPAPSQIFITPVFIKNFVRHTGIITEFFNTV